MTTASTWQLPPNSAAPPKTNPALTLNPSATSAAAAMAEADLRHRAHCLMCSPEPADASAYVDALFAAHAPWLTTRPPAARPPGRPRLAQLLTNRAES